MPPLNLEALRKSAVDLATRPLAGKKAEIVLEDSDTVASSKETLHRFVVRPADEPNGPHTTIVLDSAGKAVDLPALAATEGREFFPAADFKLDLPAGLLARRVTIDPKVNDIQLTECGFRETITVTIPKQVIRQPVDVYFLADNTFSMFPSIANVQAGAAAILGTLGGVIPDIHFGVGNYRDFTDAVSFANLQSLTASQPAALAAINSWTASGGDDIPEADLWGLHEVATLPAINWRPNALKFIVWFGDAPSHEPICGPVWGGGFPITRTTVINDLHAWATADQPHGIAVLAVSVNSGPGLDAPSTGGYPGCPSNGVPNQAKDITTATAGSLSSGVNPGAVAATIFAALIKAIAIQNVNLVPTGAIASFVTSITPPGGYGPLNPLQPHTLTFDLTFERNAEACSLRDQVFTGSIDVVMDKVVVARKPTKITIPKCRYHYVAKFVCGVNEMQGDQCSPLRPGRYATEINLHNGYCSDAVIEKIFTAVVLKGEPIGREPRVGKEVARDKITLPPQTATMDDCCRLAELLKLHSNGPLNIGFLEIISSVPLTVTAVYTATGLKDEAVSLEVEQIREVRR